MHQVFVNVPAFGWINGRLCDAAGAAATATACYLASCLLRQPAPWSLIRLTLPAGTRGRSLNVGDVADIEIDGATNLDLVDFSNFRLVW